MVFFGNGFQDRKHAHVHGTISGTVAATRAEHRAELLGINLELVMNALPLSLRLDTSRVMARGMQREHGELAGVPVSRPNSARGVAFIYDVEAMAGRAGERASATAETTQRRGLPLGLFIAAGQECLDGREIELDRRFLHRRRLLGRWGGRTREQLAALFGQAAHFVLVVAQGEQNRVGTAGVARTGADRRAEAEVVVLAAGQGDDRGQLAPPIVRFVLRVPVEHAVEDGQRRGVARTRADDDLLGRRQFRRNHLDPLALELVAVKDFVTRKHELLDRIGGPDESVERQLIGSAEPNVLEYRGAMAVLGIDVRRPRHAFAVGEPTLNQLL